MITEGILNVFYIIVRGLLTLLPDVSWDTSGYVMGTFLEFIEICYYFLPVGTIITILALVITINNFKIVISFIKTLWNLIPFA